MPVSGMRSRGLDNPPQGDTMGLQGMLWYMILYFHLVLQARRPISEVHWPGGQPLPHNVTRNHSGVLFAAILHIGISAPTISFQTWDHIIPCSLLVPCQTVLWCWHRFSFYFTLLTAVETLRSNFVMTPPSESPGTKALKSLPYPCFGIQVVHLH